jgi:hypothetical protein
MSPFRQHYDSVNPETLALLETVLNETWAALKSNRNKFDEIETQTAMADLIVNFAAQGQRDPKKLKALVLAAFIAEDDYTKATSAS